MLDTRVGAVGGDEDRRKFVIDFAGTPDGDDVDVSVTTSAGAVANAHGHPLEATGDFRAFFNFDPDGVATKQLLLDLAPLYADKKTFASFLLDETAGRALPRDEPAERTLTISGGLSYAAWMVGTIAGVAGGLGDYFNVDPAIFRLAFVGLMFIGGAGLPLYGVAWLFVPDRDSGRSVGDGLLSRFNVGNRSTGRIVLAVLVVVILANSGRAFGGQWLWAALLVGLGFLLFRDSDDDDDDRPGRPSVSGEPPTSSPPRSSRAGRPRSSGRCASSPLGGSPAFGR